MSQPAVFLDRDGVLVEDGGPFASGESLRIIDGVPEALTRLKSVGFALPVVTNQTVVSRGLRTLVEVDQTHQDLSVALERLGLRLDGFYVCPHHPNATLPEYRLNCECRKPKPGLLLQAADELDLDLGRSYMIGDRISDIAAGAGAGVVTILVQTGKHDSLPIESDAWPDPVPEPDFVCRTVAEAVEIILRHDT